MLFDLFRSGDPTQILINLLVRAFVVFCTLPVHEFAHAWVATRLGDQTARLSGRLTLNPIRHVDPLGALLIFVVGFGYAKPVPVNPRNFKDGKKGMALTAAAGPIMNLIMAFLFLLLMYVAGIFVKSSDPTSVPAITVMFFQLAASINISLAVFNLLPVPPLDGSRIFTLFLPRDLYFKWMQYERYIVWALFALIIFGVLDLPISLLSGWIYDGLNWLASLPFRLIFS